MRPLRGNQSAAASAQIVGMSSLKAAPMGDRPAIRTHALLALTPSLGPASRRVLPLLLPPIDCEVKQSVAVVHRLDAAPRGPVRLENLGSLSQVANDVHQARLASGQESVERVLGRRVPWHLVPSHEIAVPDALFVRAL